MPEYSSAKNSRTSTCVPAGTGNSQRISGAAPGSQRSERNTVLGTLLGSEGSLMTIGPGYEPDSPSRERSAPPAAR